MVDKHGRYFIKEFVDHNNTFIGKWAGFRGYSEIIK